MKRDWDLIRDILLHVEKVGYLNHGELKDYPADLASGHVAIMTDAGLVISEPADAFSHYLVQRMTWEGHEFLDKIREEDVWEETKQTLLDKAVSAGFDLITSISSAIIASKLNG